MQTFDSEGHTFTREWMPPSDQVAMNEMLRFSNSHYVNFDRTITVPPRRRQNVTIVGRKLVGMFPLQIEFELTPRRGRSFSSAQKLRTEIMSLNCPMSESQVTRDGTVLVKYEGVMYLNGDSDTFDIKVNSELPLSGQVRPSRPRPTRPRTNPWGRGKRQADMAEDFAEERGGRGRRRGIRDRIRGAGRRIGGIFRGITRQWGRRKRQVDMDNAQEDMDNAQGDMDNAQEDMDDAQGDMEETGSKNNFITLLQLWRPRNRGKRDLESADQDMPSEDAQEHPGHGGGGAGESGLGRRLRGRCGRGGRGPFGGGRGGRGGRGPFGGGRGGGRGGRGGEDEF